MSSTDPTQGSSTPGPIQGPQGLVLDVSMDALPLDQAAKQRVAQALAEALEKELAQGGAAMMGLFGKGAVET